jgi:hypothetical protein
LVKGHIGNPSHFMTYYPSDLTKTPPMMMKKTSPTSFCKRTQTRKGRKGVWHQSSKLITHQYLALECFFFGIKGHLGRCIRRENHIFVILCVCVCVCVFVSLSSQKVHALFNPILMPTLLRSWTRLLETKRNWFLRDICLFAIGPNSI